jgi:starch synthase (maltosyl-transferring)
MSVVDELMGRFVGPMTANIRQGRVRPVIESVAPTVDGGRFPVKREVGDILVVEADIFSDGHSKIACELRFKHSSDAKWSSTLMSEVGNDKWRGEFLFDRIGRWLFSLKAGVDDLATWAHDLEARVTAAQDVTLELEVGARLLAELSERAKREDRLLFAELSRQLRDWSGDSLSALELVIDSGAVEASRRYPEPATCASSDRYPVEVERARARFGSWYELFPRSTSGTTRRHGTLQDVRSHLEYVAGLGFDVLYLPPIHPIGTVNRKGSDGSVRAEPGEPGSPWAIGSREGGHMALHRELGTIADLEELVEAAARLEIEVALDLAFQCAPDHPWVTEHPDWFQTLPDGSIRYAENPPKRYEDIYPIDFDTDDWQNLWSALSDVVRFWISHGIRIFRVDNPHTKPLRFWEWLIASVRSDYPDVIFLSEAFTRPKVMYRLAKVGFSQSYTYFAWRTQKWELEQYLTELHSPPVAEFLRANLWPNTPDILTEQLQNGGRATFMSRLILAGTLASSYGIYGPAFELQENRPRSPGSEEYLHSEKYEIRHWNLEDPRSLAPLVTVVNRIRRENESLRHDRNLKFHWTDNEQLIAYSRRWVDPEGEGDNTLIMVVNLDPTNVQSGYLGLDFGALGIDGSLPYGLHDLLTDSTYTWSGDRNYVSLDPSVVPAHILRIEPIALERALPHRPEPRSGVR